jgi:hypothetical protein
MGGRFLLDDGARLPAKLFFLVESLTKIISDMTTLTSMLFQLPKNSCPKGLDRESIFDVKKEMEEMRLIVH